MSDLSTTSQMAWDDTDERAEFNKVHMEMLEYMHNQMLNLRFPAHKADIARLSHDEKMEWYAHQFQKNPGAYPVELTSSEFARFWKWRVLMPMRFKRLFYRVKNGEIFRHYQHITEMKKKVRPHSI